MSIRAINWAREVCERLDVPPNERLVLWAICIHHHDKTGECFPCYDTLAKQTGFKRRKVIYSVDDLEANGLLIRQIRRVAGHQGSNHYVLFGQPSGKKWTRTRVHHKAPCESARGCTLPRVHGGAPDRDSPVKGGCASGFRVVNGGRRHA